MQPLASIRSYLIVAAFPLLLLCHIVAFYLLPFLVTIITLLVVGVVGIATTLFALWRLVTLRNRSARVALVVVLATWLVWFALPTRELSILARFTVERHNYDAAVGQTIGGAVPTCIVSHECQSDGHTPPYLLFPFPGFLTAWVGVVHVPEENQAPLLERLEQFGTAPACDPTPIAPHYYVCGFY